MRCISVEKFFNNFAQKTKLSIILALKEKPLSVSEITKKLNEEQSKVSHSLKKLAECNILKVKKDGKQRIYSLNKDTVLPLLNLVEEHVKNHCKKCQNMSI